MTDRSWGRGDSGRMPGGDAAAELLVVDAAVDVRTAPERAFSLVSDLRDKARLNPNVEVLHVALLGDEPVRLGSVFHHRFRRAGRIAEYRTRCIAYEPPRRWWSRSDTEPPFEVRVHVDPRPDGCRITQEERMAVTPAVLDALEPPPGPDGLRAALGWMAIVPGLSPLDGHVRALQRERVRRRLGAELGAWLHAIRAHLEAGAPERRSGAA